MTPQYWPLPSDLTIGVQVLDADGAAWRVLYRPSGKPPADGSFAAMDGSCRQRYGEHMKRPVTPLPPAPRSWFVLDGRGDVASGPWKSRRLARIAWRILDPFGRLAYVAQLPANSR